MPIVSEYPRFRTHTKRGKNGQSWVSYWYDMRGTGQKDIALGTDRDEALRLWRLASAGAEITPPVRPKRQRKEKVKKIRRPARLPVLRQNKRRQLDPTAWAGLPAWAKPMYLNAERRSMEAGRPAFISLRDFADVVTRAGGKCEVTGIEFADAGSRHPFSPSFDRIDSRLGYVAGNVRIVCLALNVAMNNWGIEPLRVICERMFAGPLPQSIQNTNGQAVPIAG